jgi:hypothetical protein
MRHLKLYCCLLIFLPFLLAGCSKQINKRVTLWRGDKIPYGTYYAYQNLSHIFEEAYIETNNQSPDNFYGDEDSASAYIVVATSVLPDEKELNALINFAMSGNQVFISALRIGQNLLDSFNLKTSTFSSFYLRADSLTLSITDPDSYKRSSFSYPGYSLGNYFTELDSSVTQILGRDVRGNANFIKLRYQGGGAVYLHLAPGAFTNFFLLHRDNKAYYDLAMSAIPASMEYVMWDDYYRHHTNGKSNTERSPFSKIGTFLKNDVLSWAFWLTILLFAIVYLVESKRKQRAIPSIKKLNNSSLDFVKTVGRLYYQRKDNKNLARKIAAHFLGHVRQRYNLPTSQLDSRFDERLAYKSGQPLVKVQDLLNEVRELELMYEMSDDQLLAFSDKIDNFINKP